MLNITHFSKSYQAGKKAVDDLTLSVEAGDIYGFIGHNGAGKSTTIKAAVGILDFEEGDIRINGISVKEDPIACKKITAYIPDSPDLYEHLTGIQYLNFIADLFQVSPEDRKSRIKEYGEAFELSSALGDAISSYSHGMKQKLAILSALIHKPMLMVLDEPFVGLDPKAALTLKNIMRELCMQGGAIFFSTHILDVAERLCNKIAIIKNGRLVVCGEMEKLLGDSSLEQLFMEVSGGEK